VKLASPRAAAVDALGNIYVTDSSPGVLRYVPQVAVNTLTWGELKGAYRP
jgi:hypothetical protein